MATSVNVFDFAEKHPNAHLVLAEYDSGEVIPEGEPTRLQVLMRLVNALDLPGEYSGIDKRVDGAVRIYFAKKRAAKKFADAVLAKPILREPGWASQSAFAYDRTARKNITASLRTPRIRRWAARLAAINMRLRSTVTRSETRCLVPAFDGLVLGREPINLSGC
jgi:hypothetical protein